MSAFANVYMRPRYILFATTSVTPVDVQPRSKGLPFSVTPLPMCQTYARSVAAPPPCGTAAGTGWPLKVWGSVKSTSPSKPGSAMKNVSWWVAVS